MTLITDLLTEQIASLRASAAVYVQQRADALASAEAAAVQIVGATARAEQLQAALDDYRALAGIEPEPAPYINDGSSS